MHITELPGEPSGDPCVFLFHFAVPVETIYACTFIPLSSRNTIIYKVNLQACHNWGKIGQDRLAPDLLLQSRIRACLLQHFSIILGAFCLSVTATGISQLICLACVEISYVLFLALSTFVFLYITPEEMLLQVWCLSVVSSEPCYRYLLPCYHIIGIFESIFQNFLYWKHFSILKVLWNW